MRSQTRDLVEKILKERGPFKKVLDVGSMEAGGGKISDLFEDMDYLGVDMRPGDNVTKVINGHDLMEEFKPESFDLVICFDTFEHDDKFWLTMDNIKKVVKPGGWIVIGMPGRSCPTHNHPGDYWRFLPQSANLLMEGLVDVEVDAQTDDPNHQGEDEIYAWGRKP